MDSLEISDVFVKLKQSRQRRRLESHKFAFFTTKKKKKGFARFTRVFYHFCLFCLIHDVKRLVLQTCERRKNLTRNRRDINCAECRALTNLILGKLVQLLQANANDLNRHMNDYRNADLHF